jgi:hypothetical protein
MAAVASEIFELGEHHGNAYEARILDWHNGQFTIAEIHVQGIARKRNEQGIYLSINAAREAASARARMIIED